MASGRALKQTKKLGRPRKRPRASLAQPAPVPENKDGWIIEGDGCYWSGCGFKKDSFTLVRAHALRFLRKFDADVVKEKLFPEWGFLLRTVPFAPQETQLPAEYIPEKILTAP